MHLVCTTTCEVTKTTKEQYFQDDIVDYVDLQTVLLPILPKYHSNHFPPPNEHISKIGVYKF